MRPAEVAYKYAKSWMVLDFFVVTLDWLEVLLAAFSVGGVARYAKTARSMRNLRMLRLLRIFRVAQIALMITERIVSEKVSIVIEIAKIIILILAATHFVACFWYGIGDAWLIVNYPNWIQRADIEHSDLGYRYACSFHWALSQFGGGMDEFVPANVGERMFANCILLIAFVAASWIVSSLASSMTRLHISAGRVAAQIRIFQQYLLQSKVSRELEQRLQRNARYTMMERSKYIEEGQVEMLTYVSEPLQAELHYELYRPVLLEHPYLRCFANECPLIMWKVCHVAVKPRLLSQGDVLFTDGQLCEKQHMFFIRSGSLEYVMMVDEKPEREILTVGQYVCEAAMWCSWMHYGSLTAKTGVQLLILDGLLFQDVLKTFAVALMSLRDELRPQCYAARFVESLNQSDLVSDLHVFPDNDFSPKHLPSDSDEEDILSSRSFLGRHFSPDR